MQPNFTKRTYGHFLSYPICSEVGIDLLQEGHGGVLVQDEMIGRTAVTGRFIIHKTMVSTAIKTAGFRDGPFECPTEPTLPHSSRFTQGIWSCVKRREKG